MYTSQNRTIAKMNKTTFSTKPPSLHQTLSPRQYECFQYLLKGYTAKMAARKMGISPRTVEWHINIIKDKLDCANKYEMIEYGHKNLLIQDEKDLIANKEKNLCQKN